MRGLLICFTTITTLSTSPERVQIWPCMIGQTTLGGTLRWYVGWDPTAETQTDMYEFEMDVQQSLRNDETMLNEYINPLMRYLEGEGEVERAALLKRMLGMTKISFVNNDEEHFVKLVTENELQININAYVQRIRPTGKPFMDALVAEAVIGADELMDAKTAVAQCDAQISTGQGMRAKWYFHLFFQS
eukprot:GEMP01116761.1.p1 GENE.GEMP01116761.1~~GEMP01116761.1.p1  ORF type:complete len:188 (+),score=22.59 GEMP01116761.1:75-638(+)